MSGRRRAFVSIITSVSIIAFVLTQGFAQSPAPGPYSVPNVVKTLLIQIQYDQQIFAQNRDACIREIRQNQINLPHPCSVGVPIDPRTHIPSAALDAFLPVYNCQRAVGNALGYYQLAPGVDSACRSGQQESATKSNYGKIKACWPFLLQATAELDQAYRDQQARNAAAANQDAAKAHAAFVQGNACVNQAYIDEFTLPNWMSVMTGAMALQYGPWFKSLSPHDQQQFALQAKQAGLPAALINGIAGIWPGTAAGGTTTPSSGSPTLCASCSLGCVLITAADRDQMLSWDTRLNRLVGGGVLGAGASLTTGLIYFTAATLRSLARTGLDVAQYLHQHGAEALTLLSPGTAVSAAEDNATRFAAAAAVYAANGDVRKTVNAALYQQASARWQALQNDFKTHPVFTMTQIGANALPLCPAAKLAAEAQAAKALATESGAFRELAAITEETATGVAQDEATLAQELPASPTQRVPLPASIGGLPVELCVTENACVPYSLGQVVQWIQDLGAASPISMSDVVNVLKGLSGVGMSPAQLHALLAQRFGQPVLNALAAKQVGAFTRRELDDIARGTPILIDALTTQELTAPVVRQLNVKRIYDLLEAMGPNSNCIVIMSFAEETTVGGVTMRTVGGGIGHSVPMRYLGSGKFQATDIRSGMNGQLWFSKPLRSIQMYPTFVAR